MAATNLTDLNADVLYTIVDYLSPKDVYALLRCCKSFWALTGDNKRRLVQQSMRVQFDRVLTAVTSRVMDSTRGCYDSGHLIAYQGEETVPWGCCPLTVAKLFPDGASLDGQGRPQFIVAGSTTVCAAVGGDWECGDIDLFVTWEAAPLIRQRLVTDCNYLCVGRTPAYSSPSVADFVGWEGADDDNHKCTLSNVFNVEAYASYPSEDWVAGYTLNDLSYPADLRSSTLVFGDQAAKGRCYYEIGQPGGSSDGQFMYDFQFFEFKTLQLIVGKEGVADARELLHSFDLTICTTYFDGARFHFPDPSRTLCAETTRMGDRKAVLDAVFRILKTETEKVGGDVRTLKAVDVIDQLDPELLARIGAVLKLASKRWEREVGNNMAWSIIQKLIYRIQKYTRRGISVEASPEMLQHEAFLHRWVEWEPLPPPPLKPSEASVRVEPPDVALS